MTMAVCEDRMDVFACAHPQAKSPMALHLWKAFMEWRKARETLRALEAMPDGMRKDFGWPTTERAANAPHFAQKDCR